MLIDDIYLKYIQFRTLHYFDCNFKMTADGNTRSEGSYNIDFHALFSDEISGILMKLDSVQRSDVADELVETLDAPTLRDLRLKVFRFAKKKLVDAVTDPMTHEIDPVSITISPMGMVMTRRESSTTGVLSPERASLGLLWIR